MNQDKEHLRLLAIFHYIVAGLATLFSFLPLLYTTIGVIFIFVARHGTPKPGEELLPEFLGWIFVGLGSLFFYLGLRWRFAFRLRADAFHAASVTRSRS